ncbi:hypothetical protein D3C77_685960 [compost metagenome]
MGIRVAQYGVRFSVVISLAVGGTRTTGLVDVAIQVGISGTVVVSTNVNVLLHHVMARLQAPRPVLPAAAQT